MILLFYFLCSIEGHLDFEIFVHIDGHVYW